MTSDPARPTRHQRKADHAAHAARPRVGGGGPLMAHDCEECYQLCHCDMDDTFLDQPNNCDHLRRPDVYCPVYFDVRTDYEDEEAADAE